MSLRELPGDRIVTEGLDFEAMEKGVKSLYKGMYTIKTMYLSWMGLVGSICRDRSTEVLISA